MENNLLEIRRRLKNPASVLFISYFTVFLIGFFDYITNPEFSFSLFYLIPIAFNTWFLNTKNGILISVFSALVWLYVDISYAQYEYYIAPYWNSAIRLGFFVIVVFLLSEIKFLYRNLADMVEVRTNQLKEEVSKKVAAEIELRKSKNLYQDLVENISEVYYTTDANGFFRYISPNFYKSTGLAENFIRNKTFYEVIYYEDAERIEKYYCSKINEKASDAICEFRINNSSNSVQWFEQTSRILIDPDGNPVEIRNLLRNINERKAAEISLIKSEMNFQKLFSEETTTENDYIKKMLQSNPSYLIKSLAERVDEVSDKIGTRIRQTLGFSSLASHELRTPLAIIRNQLEENLREDISLNILKETTASIYDEVLRLQRIIGDLLKLSTMEAGNLKLHKKIIRLDTLINSFYEETILLAQEKNINIKLSNSVNINAEIDKAYFLQMLFNIFDNALKYTPVNGNISIGCGHNNSEVTIFIKDSGKGIPPDVINKIFTPFYQNAPDNSSGGTGLGLILSKWIAELHNGRIEVKSEIGKGTTVLMKFPYHFS